MEWIIKIEDKANQRFKFTYEPLNDKIICCGEYKIKNREWTNFVEFSYIVTNGEVSLDTLKRLMKENLINFKNRIHIFENLSEGFTVFKAVSIE